MPGEATAAGLGEGPRHDQGPSPAQTCQAFQGLLHLWEGTGFASAWTQLCLPSHAPSQACTWGPSSQRKLLLRGSMFCHAHTICAGGRVLVLWKQEGR